MGSKTYLCRCEEVTLEEIRELIEEGYISMEEIKRKTRCTMGPCQGRTCRDLIAKEIAKKRGINITDVDIPTNRPPTKPTKLGVIAKGRGSDE